MEVKEKKGLSALQYSQLAAVRNKLGAEIKAHEDAIKELKAKRHKVDTEFLRRFNEEGITSVKTPHGTPYILTRTAASVSDKDAFMAWMRENNAFDFMNVSANKTMVAAYVEEKEMLPPGISWTAIREIGLNKS